MNGDEASSGELVRSVFITMQTPRCFDSDWGHAWGKRVRFLVNEQIWMVAKTYHFGSGGPSHSAEIL